MQEADPGYSEDAHKYDPTFAPHYLKKINSEKAEEALVPYAFDKHFNHELRLDALYFQRMHKFLECVEKNQALGEQPKETTCQKEFMQMRRSAIQGELFYHKILRKYYYQYTADLKREMHMWAPGYCWAFYLTLLQCYS